MATGRRWSKGAVVGVALLSLAGMGCSGTHRTGPSVAAPGTNGALAAVRIQPAPGSTFISRSTTFRLSWTENDPPPAQFTVALRRYSEGNDENGPSIDTQVTDLVRSGETFNWTVKRRDDFDLDVGGVYYLELTSSGELIDAAYVVSTERSREAAKPTAAPITTPPLVGVDRAAVHQVQLR